MHNCIKFALVLSWNDNKNIFNILFQKQMVMCVMLYRVLKNVSVCDDIPKLEMSSPKVGWTSKSLNRPDADI